MRSETKGAPIHPERLKNLLLLEVTKTHARHPLDNLGGEQNSHTLIPEGGPRRIKKRRLQCMLHKVLQWNICSPKFSVLRQHVRQSGRVSQ